MYAYFFTLHFLLFFCVDLDPMPTAPVSNKWVVTKVNLMHVEGKTNMSPFGCSINNDERADTLLLTTTSTMGLVKMAGDIKMAVQKFDCNNALITRDLRKTLNAKVYPAMYIKLIRMAKYPKATGSESIDGEVNIWLAGKEKQYDLTYRITNMGARCFRLTGLKKINFSDFGLVPPKKMGGILKTNDELTITFELDVRLIDE